MEEIIPSSLNLFSKPQTLLSVNEFTYEQITTKTALDGITPQLEFTVPADKVNYTDLKESYVMVKCRMVKADGSVVGATPAIGVVNNPVTSMFKSMGMSINDTRVTPNEINMPYIHFLHAFTQTKDAKESYLTAGLYYEDTMTSAETMNQSNPQAQADANPNVGLKTRTQMFANGKEVMLIGKLHIPPHTTNRLYLPHLKFDYTFELAPIAFYCMSATAAGTHKFIITDAKMLIRRVSLAPAVQIAHEQLLQTQNALYPMKYIKTKTQNIPANSWAYYWENVFVGNEMPSSILVAFVKNSAHRGSLTENPFFFQNMDLTDLTVHLGTKKIPNIDIKNNIGQNQSLLSFWETMKSMDFFSSNTGPGGFDRTTFENAAFLLGFDLTRDGNPNAGYSNSNFNAGNLALQMNFGTSTTEAYTGKCSIYTRTHEYFFILILFSYGIWFIAWRARDQQ